MIIANASQVREIEAQTMSEYNMSSLQLMERAAQKCVDILLNLYPSKETDVVIFAGPGGNGGDGLAIARLLCQAGYHHIKAYLFNTRQSLSDDCSSNAERLKNECPNTCFIEVTQQFEPPKLTSKTLIIDAIFGIGLTRPLSGGFATLVRFINASDAQVVSVDIPSGLMCEDNSLNTPSTIVKAQHTITFSQPKLCMMLDDCQSYIGTLHIADMGFSEEAIRTTDTPYYITQHDEMVRELKKRVPWGHKGIFGHALLIAGSYGMAGAAILAAQACLKGGIGKLTIHTPLLNNDILQIAVPEATLSHDPHDRYYSQAIPATNYKAIGIGPGIGTNKDTAIAFIEQVSHAKAPLVLDADAINILGSHKGWIPQVPAYSIFTPHPKEMQRLGIFQENSYSLLLEAISMATRHKFYIILKGHHTAICTPDGKVFFNTTGNSGMATAGAGDVLTGLLTALLAQGYATTAACRLAVYIHGLAGNLASKELGEYSVTAQDILSHIPLAFKTLTQ